MSTETAKKEPDGAGASAPKESMVDDYLMKDDVLACPDSGSSDWEIGTRVIASKVLTPASEKTKGEYEVAYAFGTMDWAKGDKRWTSLVITKSRTAVKKELKKGMLVLATKRPVDEGLRTATWSIVRVSSLDELYKDKVIVRKRFTGVGGGFEEESYPVSNIRIIDEPKITIDP